jgi:DNA-binding response OmpR family regulator
MRILVVEDERKVADALRDGLAAEDYIVDVERNGTSAFERVTRDGFDLILLDLGLPGHDGLAILREIRARDIPTRVLVLTARDALHDRVLGLDAGADDYLVKPFAFAELVARVRALLRRGSMSEATRFTVGELSLDRATRKVMRAGRTVDLTVREFDLLEYLMRYARQVVSRDALAREVWKETSRSTPLDNVIDVHLARLRRKVDGDHPVRFIHTVRGVGFTVTDAEP